MSREYITQKHVKQLDALIVYKKTICCKQVKTSREKNYARRCFVQVLHCVLHCAIEV